MKYIDAHIFRNKKGISEKHLIKTATASEPTIVSYDSYYGELIFSHLLAWNVRHKV
ncbi:hypothetical protein IMPR6_160022 [Imperialibacter sp. EC-SDR9]|nr:hypothetical protein IMPERIA89_10421 [Imperialibacter sp. 89]CAD5264757.1 hypothetical protein IMPERIA75_30127 [Imperialibacter sp. 75]VVT06627.1 hypothetical protein IMPR6_160022 [Imperialibacter sp. EC-SDR9]